VTHWSDAGFGTDPEGDAARRAELESRRVDPADLDDPTGLRRLAESRLALPTGGPRGRTPDLVIVDDPLDGEVVELLTAHAITRTEYPWGVAWTCACGRWEGVATGPSSARWAGADHARHVRDEDAGTRGE
jgi:hypothetical protein